MNYIIAIGANLGDREGTIARALELIEVRLGPIERRSAFHETEPLLNPVSPVYGQPMYLNGVILIRAPFGPGAVLEKLLAIEGELGRIRDTELVWGPRLIDLDLIAAEDTVCQTRTLVLPHPEMHKRAFVLAPMLEIVPDWVHPLFGLAVGELYFRLQQNNPL